MMVKNTIGRREEDPVPFSVEGTSNGIPEMGTLPIAVRAVTSAVPLSCIATEGKRVTAANISSKAPSFSDCSGWFWNEISRSTRFPVDTPPFAGALASLSCTSVSNRQCLKTNYTPQQY